MAEIARALLTTDANVMPSRRDRIISGFARHSKRWAATTSSAQAAPVFSTTGIGVTMGRNTPCGCFSSQVRNELFGTSSLETMGRLEV